MILKLLPLLKKAPKWAISGMIVLTSVIVFSGWLIFRTPQDGRASFHRTEQEKQKARSVDFNLADVVLCGNRLVNFHTGQVIFKDWLDGAGDNMPPIALAFPDDKLLVIEKEGMAAAFGFDGKQKPLLSVDGKPIGAAAFSHQNPIVVFVRDGNLWKGKPDWVNSAVTEVKRITDVGYFRNNLFTGEYFWTGGNLYVSILGRPHLISIDDGKVKEDPAPIGRLIHGASPDRKLAALGLNLGQFGIADFATSELKNFPTVGEVKQVRWLTKDRVAVLGSYRQLSIYDHLKRKVIGNFVLKTQITSVASGSPDGKFVLLGTNDGIKLLEIDSGEFTPMTLPISDGGWISNDTFICSNPTTDSEVRGVWLVKVNGSRSRISNQPFDSVHGMSGREPLVCVSSGAIWVSGGNIWRYDSGTGEVKQLTHEQDFKPNLQLLTS